jgi:hypothetical protein
MAGGGGRPKDGQRARLWGAATTQHLMALRQVFRVLSMTQRYRVVAPSFWRDPAPQRSLLGHYCAHVSPPGA